MMPIIGDPLTAALNIGSQLIDRIFPDPEKKAAAQLELLRMQQSGELVQITGQLDINKEEAKSSSFFVAGWRPFIGWVCGAGCAWNWVGLPVAKFAAVLLGMKIEIAPADLSEMFPLLLGMLGIGGLRTFEKVKKVA